MTPREERRKYMLLTTTKYINAMCRKDCTGLPLSDNLRVTYNAEESKLGENEVWTYAQRIPDRQTFADPDTGEVILFAIVTNDTVVKDGIYLTPDRMYHSLWYQYVLRLKFDKDLICEIEEVVNSRPVHKYTPFEHAHFSELIYEVPVPVDARVSKDEMIAIVDSYWSGCAKEVGEDAVPCHPDCQRHENCDLATDTSHFPFTLSGEFNYGNFLWNLPRSERRFPIVDEERGVVVSMCIMANAGVGRGGQVIEAFKIEYGIIRRMDCIYRVLGGVPEKSGWAKE